MKDLQGHERRFLMKRAHSLNPVVMIGKEGLSEGVTAATDRELDNHELIKVRFIDYKEGRQEITRELAERCKAQVVQVIGNVAVLFRQAEAAEDRRIHLPLKK